MSTKKTTTTKVSEWLATRNLLLIMNHRYEHAFSDPGKCSLARPETLCDLLDFFGVKQVGAAARLKYILGAAADTVSSAVSSEQLRYVEGALTNFACSAKRAFRGIVPKPVDYLPQNQVVVW